MKYFIYAVIITVALSNIIYGYGVVKYKEGQRDLLADVEKARARSMEEKQEIDDEIQNLTDDELLSRALRWVMRSPGR